MELIKLISFLTFGIIIRQLNFVFIISFFWIINLCIGIYLNRTYFESLDTIIGKLIFFIIIVGEWMYHKIKYFINYISRSKIGLKTIKYTGSIDKMYLDGRKCLFKSIKTKAMGYLPNILNNNKIKLSGFLEKKRNISFDSFVNKTSNTKRVLDKKTEINNFLDALIDIKKEI